MMRNTKKRRSKRPPPQRSKNGRKLAGALLLAGALASVIYLVAAIVSPFFRMPSIPVERVRIEGAGSLDSAKILEKAGIGGDTDIMTVDLAASQRALLAREPYIERVRITRNPASGEIDISVRLRTPAAFVNASGSLFAVDRDGFVIGGMEKVDFSDLPVITGLNLSPPAPGSTIAGGLIAPPLQIISCARSSGLDARAPVSEVNMSDPRQIIVYAGPDGMQIRLGLEDIPEKISEAAAIVAYLQQEGEKAEYIDLRFRKTIVKPSS